MHSATRAKLIAMPLIKLRKLRSDLDSLVREVEPGPGGRLTSRQNTVVALP